MRWNNAATYLLNLIHFKYRCLYTAGLESVTWHGHYWQKIIISLYFYSYKIQEAIKYIKNRCVLFIQFTNTICCWFGVTGSHDMEDKWTSPRWFTNSTVLPQSVDSRSEGASDHRYIYIDASLSTGPYVDASANLEEASRAGRLVIGRSLVKIPTTGKAELHGEVSLSEILNPTLLINEGPAMSWWLVQGVPCPRPETRLGLVPAATPRDPMERVKWLRTMTWHDMTWHDRSAPWTNTSQWRDLYKVHFYKVL